MYLNAIRSKHNNHEQLQANMNFGISKRKLTLNMKQNFRQKQGGGGKLFGINYCTNTKDLESTNFKVLIAFLVKKKEITIVFF